MGHELELKLAMTPKALSRLRRHPLIRSLAGGRRAHRLELTATYYDTPDRRLAARGIALRVRSDGKHAVQTLKAPVDDGRGLQSVAEHEAPLPDGRLDITLIADEALADFLAEAGVGDALAPVFETRILRHLLPVRLLDSEVEIAFDQGEVVAGDRREAVCEAEFELKAGRIGALYQLALSVIEHVPFRLETRSKAARGYALADGAAPTPPAARSFSIDAEASVGEAFAAVARNCLRPLRANQEAIAEGSEEPETVHQLRVAIRRLRAALSVFGPYVAEPCFDYLAGELKWLQNGLGPARDWDVFATETLAPMRRRLPEERVLDELAARVEEHRAASRQAAREMLALPRYTVFVLRLEQWLEDGGWARPAGSGTPEPAEQPAEPLFRRRLAKRAGQVLTSGRKRDESDAASLHRLRIACKKLRYALEFAAPMLAKGGVKPALEGLRALQECLGSLNDAAVTKRLLEQAGDAGPRQPDRRALGLVTGWQANRIETDLGHLRRAWKGARKAIRALR